MNLESRSNSFVGKSATSSIRAAFLLGLVGVAFLSSVDAQTAAPKKQENSDQVEPATLGSTKNVHRLGNLYFAGQFAKEDVETLKAAKIKRVVTFRNDGEVKWDEQAAVESAGLKFLSVPVGAPDTLTDEVFGSARKAIGDQSETTLLHCGSATRVGCVWLTYRVLDEGVALKQAVEEAEQIGLKSAAYRDKAVDYIKRNQEKAPMTEQSVKPGINDNFVDPDLDVDSFVERFEIESREIYLERDAILKATGIKAGDSVADVGAGTGLFTRLFSKTVGDKGWVYAVDISPRFLEHINKESAKQKLSNITGVLCSSNSACLPPNSVDVIFVCDTYHHFEYPKSTLESLHRALKKGGRLVVIDFERIEGKSRDWLMGHVRAGKEVFRAEIQDAGFSMVEEVKIGGFKENYFLVFAKQSK